MPENKSDAPRYFKRTTPNGKVQVVERSNDLIVRTLDTSDEANAFLAELDPR